MNMISSFNLLRPLTLSLLVSTMPFGAALADGEFLQLDAAEDSTLAVASIERRPLTYSATFYNGDEGRVLGASVLYRLATAEEGSPVTVKFGPSVGFTDEGDEDAEAEVGLKLTADRWINIGFGGLYFQGEANSVNSAWFLLGQAVFLDPGLTLEATYGESDTYSETSLAISKRLGNGPVSLRAGHRFDADSWFVGAYINTF